MSSAAVSVAGLLLNCNQGNSSIVPHSLDYLQLVEDVDFISLILSSQVQCEIFVKSFTYFSHNIFIFSIMFSGKS